MDNPSEKLDIEHLRSWVGREEIVTDIISVDLTQKFIATFNLSTAIPVAGEVAPLLINYCLAPPILPTHHLGEDGHPQRGGFLPPVPLPRRMWAGSSLSFHRELHVGDLVQRTSRIAEIAVKEGRSGTLCFVDVDHKLEVEGDVVIEETQRIVYRQAATLQDASKPIAAETAPTGMQNQLIAVSSPLLFRYSSLTFNGHRIHYDRAYAMEVEHYPGLVVHGPLQATFLLNYATELKNRAPTKFTFRSQTPLYDYDKVRLHATEEGEGKMRLWTARDSGPVGMSADAIWS